MPRLTEHEPPISTNGARWMNTQGRVKIAACTELVTLSGELWNNCGA
jgi:hypothetical protein